MDAKAHLFSAAAPCRAPGITQIAKAGWDVRPLARSVESNQYSQGDLRPMIRFVPAATAALMFAAIHGSAWSQTVKLETSMGDIVVELDAQKAPKSVANFVMYVKAGHYNGTVFHRVIPNFMIQGGGMDDKLAEKPTKPPIPLEARNGLLNVRGTLAMARTNDPNSATSQFFINLKDNAFLDQANSRDGNGYAVFGKVIAGMDVVDRIKDVRTTRKGPNDDVPVEPVFIKKATVEKS
jgi:peptidyl-prolyl cis-trans isomerase A (cyclophilin A)